MGSVTLSEPVTAPVAGFGADSVTPADWGGEFTGAGAARAANVVGVARVWLVSIVAGAVLCVVVPRSRRAAAAKAQSIGDSTGAGAGASGALGSVGAIPIIDATSDVIVEESTGAVVSFAVCVAGAVTSVAAWAVSAVDVIVAGSAAVGAGLRSAVLSVTV